MNKISSGFTGDEKRFGLLYQVLILLILKKILSILFCVRRF